jgi:hypothetical protein
MSKGGAADESAVQKPQEVMSAAKLDEIVAYRFRLGTEDVAWELAASNRTDQSGRFLVVGVTPESESRPRAAQPIQLDPGQTKTLSAANLKWPDFQWVYVEASRRIQLRLVREGEPTAVLALPNMTSETVCDIVSEQRLGEVSPSDAERAVRVLGAGSQGESVLRIGEDSRTVMERVPESTRQTNRPRIFVITPLKPRS